MIQTLYLAECSKTYRRWIPSLVKGYVREIVDLWEDPQALIEMDSAENLLMIDEAFLGKGPGPACMALSSLLEPRKIVTIPIVVLRRRERRLNDLSPRVFQLRRPFYERELEEVLNQFCKEGRKLEEVDMSEDLNLDSNIIRKSGPLESVAPPLDEEIIQKITREAIEKAVREIVPGLAEKIIREEIRRLTE